MIFNLVEAAQEFLSALVSVDPLHNRVYLALSDLRASIVQFILMKFFLSIVKVVSFDGGNDTQLPTLDVTKSSEKITSSKHAFVYGFTDLFSGYEESYNWNFGANDGGVLSSSMVSQALSRSKQIFEGVEKNFKQKEKSMREDNRFSGVVSVHAKLESVKNTSEDESKGLLTTDSSSSFSEDLVAEKDKKVCSIFLWCNTTFHSVTSHSLTPLSGSHPKEIWGSQIYATLHLLAITKRPFLIDT